MRDDAFYWEGLAQRELRLRVCDGCGRAACPPRPGCPHCGDPRGSVRVASGHGRLYSWIVCHVAFDPAFAADVPYVVGVVELPEGLRVVSRLTESDVSRLHFGQSVRLVVTPLHQEEEGRSVTTYAFRPEPS